MDPPRWLVDEMLGRLARYLRVVGCDTAYGRGSSDDELVALAEKEERVLLTRDRMLSRRTRWAFLIESPALREQWRAVRSRWPAVPTTVSFARCTLCNGLLEARPPAAIAPAGLPAAVREKGEPVYACRACGHLYWDGSHTRQMREQISAWEQERP